MAHVHEEGALEVLCLLGLDGLFAESLFSIDHLSVVLAHAEVVRDGAVFAGDGHDIEAEIDAATLTIAEEGAKGGAEGDGSAAVHPAEETSDVAAVLGADEGDAADLGQAVLGGAEVVGDFELVGIGIVVDESDIADAERVVDIGDVSLYVAGLLLELLAGPLLVVLRLYHVCDAAACHDDTCQGAVVVMDCHTAEDAPSQHPQQQYHQNQQHDPYRRRGDADVIVQLLRAGYALHGLFPKNTAALLFLIHGFSSFRFISFPVHSL